MNLEQGIFWGVVLLLVCFYDEAEIYVEHRLDHQKRMDHLEYMEKTRDVITQYERKVWLYDLEKSIHEADSIFKSY